MSNHPRDLYRAAALGAYIQKGFDKDVAVELAIMAADKMYEETVEISYPEAVMHEEYLNGTEV